jgi:hypothetical protein
VNLQTPRWWCAWRTHIARRADFSSRGGSPCPMIDGSVPVGSVLGPGTVLLAGVVITTPLRIGAHVVAMPHVLITHDDKITVGSRSAGPLHMGSVVLHDVAGEVWAGVPARRIRNRRNL